LRENNYLNQSKNVSLYLRNLLLLLSSIRLLEDLEAVAMEVSMLTTLKLLINTTLRLLSLVKIVAAPSFLRVS
jgi:hypothetical protein